MVGQEHVIRERQVEQQGGGQAEVTFAHGLEVRPGKEQHTYDISSVITSRMHDSMLGGHVQMTSVLKGGGGLANF